MDRVRRRVGGRDRRGLLVLPALALLVVAFLAPVATLLAKSVTEPPGGLSHYEEFLGEAGLVTILLRTVWTAVVVTTISLLVSFPVAHLAATSGPRARAVVIGIVGASLFVSLVVRCYAWLAILDREGALNTLLGDVGLGALRFTAVHNFAGVVIGVVQFTIPLMVLPLYDVMRRFDPRLRLAALSLGASPLRAFVRVYLPHVRPGIVAGVVVVFITTLGYYIAPSILGGPQDMMVGQLIAQKIRTTVEWGLGAAIATVLLGVALVLLAVFARATAASREPHRA